MENVSKVIGLLPSVGGACFVFVSNRVPVIEIKNAPIGAVSTMLNMQTIIIVSA